LIVQDFRKLLREKEIFIMDTIFFDKVSLSAVTRIVGQFLLVVAILALLKILFIPFAIGAGCTIVCQVLSKSSWSGYTWNADGIVSSLNFRLRMTT
jgi:hypothetical protein